jgi:hypothetical protein
VFDYPTLSAIVGYLDTTLAAQQPEAAAAPAAPAAVAAPRVPAKAPPAVGYAEQAGVIWVSAVHSRFPDPPAIAAAGVVPGSSLLHDIISVVPLERYDVEVQLTQDIPARFGGFLPAVQVRSLAVVVAKVRSWVQGSKETAQCSTVHSGQAHDSTADCVLDHRRT